MSRTFNAVAIRRRRQGGLSLIELMIGMVIGLVLLGGIVQTMLASREASATRRSVSTITDNARFLFDFMARDLRMAGRGFCVDGDDDFPGGCDDAQWPVDGSGDPLSPVQFADNALTLRYLAFDDTDDDGDLDPALIEAVFSLNGNELIYSRRTTSDMTDDRFDPDALAGYTNQPLISSVDGLVFEFARIDADGTYAYHSNTTGWGLAEWGRVTAVRISVTFVDPAPWGQGIEDQDISFTVALRNQVARRFGP